MTTTTKTGRLWLASTAAAIVVAAGAVVAAGEPRQAATVTVAPTADTYVQFDKPATNFGTSVRWSTEGRADIRQNALLRFDVTLPAGERVVSARVRAYAEAAVPAGEFVDIHQITGTWTEAGVTWDNAPVGGTWLSKAGPFALGQWVEWDVTPAIGDGGYVNFKLETNARRSVGFTSREAVDTTLRPQLVVTTESPPTPTPTPTPTPPPPAPARGSVTIAAVGDMNGVRTTSRASASAKNAASIGDALAAGEVESFIGLGDFQYDTAYCADYVNYWNKLWGRVKEHTYWVSAPNHDWQPGRNEDLDNFMNGQCPGDTSKSRINAERGFISNGQPYSFDKGNWHFALLPSALWRYDEAKGQRVTAWLDRDLAAAEAAGKHLAVVYHEPYYTSNTASHTRETDQKPWIDVMDKHNVRLTLSGSQHNYERSCPVNKADRCVADGMTAFQVSTGGIGLRAFTSSPAYIRKRFSDTHGWLKLRLNADGSFSWNFVPVSGAMRTDRGTRAAP